ncbi:right-handed parallel beta-helix repeat-containing protein [Candidatus Gottesmanbacteria bacterium]|nr:right-handed parallel beta-helix repeat-containing protein [Candidatus Gottesmanbacteria bacterium]
MKGEIALVLTILSTVLLGIGLITGTIAVKQAQKIVSTAAETCLISSSPNRLSITESNTTYKLCNGQNYSGGIDVNAENVTIDGTDGAIIDGGNATDRAGIQLNSAGGAIKNVIVKGFLHGIKANNVSNITIQNVNASDNSKGGKDEEWLGPILKSTETGGGILFDNVSDSKILNSKAMANIVGITLYRSKNIEVNGGDYSNNSGWGIRLITTTDSQIKNLTANYNTRSNTRCPSGGCESANIILLESSNRNLIEGNILNNGGDGFFINGCGSTPSNNNVIRENTANNSPNNAFEATFSTENLFENNTSSGSKYGFWLGYSDKSKIINNTVGAISGAINIANSRCNTVTNNTVTSGTNLSEHRIWKDNPDVTCEAQSGITECKDNVLYGNTTNPGYPSCTNTKTEVGAKLPTSCGVESTPYPTNTPTPGSDCPDISAKTYTSTQVYKVGPKIAANNDPRNYKQIRKLYNCKNADAKDIWIPTTVIFDQATLLKEHNDAVTRVTQNLRQMKNYGLLPIIRVASQTTGAGNTWLKIGPEDASKMGTVLNEAINSVGFNPPVAIYFGNEPNLDKEWSGSANAEDYAKSLAAFLGALNNRNSYKVYFTPLSYGARTEDISPATFLEAVFTSTSFSGKKIDGAALTIYGPGFNSIKEQVSTQKAAFNPYLSYFSGGFKALITEVGPTANGSVIDGQGQENVWIENAQNIFVPYIEENQNIPDIPYATTAFFTSSETKLVIVKNDGNPEIISLECRGQETAGQSNCRDDSSPTPTPSGEEPTDRPSPTRSGGGTTPQPTSPGGDGDDGTAGTLRIEVNRRLENGTKRPWRQSDGTAKVYISGPTRGGSEFSVTMDVPTTNDNNCFTDPEANGETYPFECSQGVIIWTPTAAGTNYSVQLYSLPDCTPPNCLRPRRYPEPSQTVRTGQTTQVELVAIPSDEQFNATLGYTNEDYQRVIEQYTKEAISPLSVSAWLTEASRVPGIQKSICYPPNCQL